ncbi:MAG: hypothetical protein IKO74_02330 [Selenomonadaceae bacterium]|nr:hypothetical protein [Selenomonadaceae bacterium]
MKSLLLQILFCTFGTVLFVYSVVEHEPPAFIAYAFGILTGVCWCGVSFLYWLRKDDDTQNFKE